MRQSGYDVIVIGLGAAGSAALYHCASSGASVLGIDRFVSPHVHGSTHSESRIIRKAYAEGVQYLPLLTRAYALWEKLEHVSSTKLMHLVGCINIGHTESEMIRASHNSALVGRIRHLMLSSGEVHQRYPAYRLRPDQAALVDLEAGYIQPELCVQAHLRQAAVHGAQCQFGTPVLSCTLKDDRVIVKTNYDIFETPRVILTAGSWMRDFVPVPLAIERVTNSWFRPTSPHVTADDCPPFILDEVDGRKSYGFPDLGDGIKVGLHHAGPLVSHPKHLDRSIIPEDQAAVRSVLDTIMPKAAGECLKTTVCMYSNMPDKNYLIDRLEGHDQHFIVGSACSGHGFKASSAVGESLAALALDTSPPVDLSPFRWR